MKAIMLSVHPEWVAKILNGEKTIEIRKSVPKDFKGWVYIYETKYNSGGGKVVVARFWFDEWEEIKVSSSYFNGKKWTADADDAERLKPYYLLGAMTENDFHKYSKGTDLFAWHIKKLEIFDTPKEISEFYRESYAIMPNGVFPCNEPLTKAPQSWCYVEVKEVLENE